MCHDSCRKRKRLSRFDVPCAMTIGPERALFWLYGAGLHNPYKAREQVSRCARGEAHGHFYLCVLRACCSVHFKQFSAMGASVTSATAVPILTHPHLRLASPASTTSRCTYTAS